MWELIKQWLAKKACCHDWIFHAETKVYDDPYSNPVYIKHTLICKKCGKIKRIKV